MKPCAFCGRDALDNSTYECNLGHHHIICEECWRKYRDMGGSPEGHRLCADTVTDADRAVWGLQF